MRVLVSQLQKVERVAFAPEGTHLFASGLHADSLGYGQPDLGLDVFDLGAGSEPVVHLLEWHVVRWFAPLTGGRVAAACNTPSDDSDYYLGISVFDWRTSRGTELKSANWEVWYPCAVSPDETRLIAGLSGYQFAPNVRRRAVVERGIGAWKLPGGPRRLHTAWKCNWGRDRQQLAVAFTPDGRTFWTADAVTTSVSPRAQIELVSRDADTGAATRMPVAYPNQLITDLAVGETFVIAHHGPTLLVYDRAKLDPKPQKLSNPANRKHFTGFAIHPSGKWLVVAGLDGAVTLWNTATWKVTQTWTWDVGQSRSVCFSADGSLAAVGTNTGKIVVWDLDL